MIPRRIIQTWKTREFPRRYRAFHRRLRKLHPDYEFVHFTDDEVDAFIRREYPEYAAAFDALPDVISRIDLFRLLAVHKLGGFYLDMDVLMRRSLEELRTHPCVFPYERHPDPYFAARHGTIEMIGQYAFGARPGHPFLLACADNIRRFALEPGSRDLPTDTQLASIPWMYGNAHTLRVLYSAGPGMITRTFIESPAAREGMKIIAAVDPDEQKKIRFCFGSFGSHQMTSSWISEMPARRIIAAALFARLLHRRTIRMLTNARDTFSSDLVMIRSETSAPVERVTANSPSRSLACSPG